MWHYVHTGHQLVAACGQVQYRGSGKASRGNTSSTKAWADVTGQNILVNVCLYPPTPVKRMKVLCRIVLRLVLGMIML